MPRTFATLLALPLALIAATTASAQPIQPFSFDALKAAQAAGKPILVDVFAPWCPTCRAQAPTIDSLATDPSARNLVILRVDFDHQSAELAYLHVNKQATLIAYKGKAELGRALGITDPGQIKALAHIVLR